MLARLEILPCQRSKQSYWILRPAIEEFETYTWDSAEIRKNAERFSIQQFRQNFVEIVKMEWALFLANKIEAHRDRQIGIAKGVPVWQQSKQPTNAKPGVVSLELAPLLKKTQDNAVAGT